MKQSIITISLISGLAAAQPVPCPLGEYAQYKDKAATDVERLARDYCALGQIVQFNSAMERAHAIVGGRFDAKAAMACVGERTKMADAASAVGKRDEFARMTTDDACKAMVAKGKR